MSGAGLPRRQQASLQSSDGVQAHQRTDRADDARQHARERRAVARRAMMSPGSLAAKPRARSFPRGHSPRLSVSPGCFAENKDARLPQTLPDALRDLSPLSPGAAPRPAQRMAHRPPVMQANTDHQARPLRPGARKSALIRTCWCAESPSAPAARHRRGCRASPPALSA